MIEEVDMKNYRMKTRPNLPYLTENNTDAVMRKTNWRRNCELIWGTTPAAYLVKSASLDCE